MASVDLRFGGPPNENPSEAAAVGGAGAPNENPVEAVWLQAAYNGVNGAAVGFKLNPDMAMAWS